MQKSYVKPWKNIADKQTIVDVVQHCFLRAFFAKESNIVTRKEILRGQFAKSFTPTTNQVKLDNGVSKFDGLKQVLVGYSYTQQTFLTKIPLLQMNSEEALETIFGGDVALQKEFWNFVQVNALAALKVVDFDEFEKRFYVYIFVEQDNVDPVHQLVQAAHVSMVIGQEMDEKISAHDVYFQVCKIPEKISILDLYHTLNKDFQVEIFYEPDVDRFIATGTHPVRSDKRKYLVNYELLVL